jgi:SAM-dependent methyltransferase
MLRAVHSGAVADLESFLATRTAREAMESGKLVRSVRVSPPEISKLAPDTDYLIEHERIPFASYPYEWPAEMLHAAGALTLELAQRALEDGFGIKDATPYNVLFRGSRPVFVDVPSFERRQPNDSVWMAYGQFVRTFLLPLLVSRDFGVPPARMLAWQRDGLEPESVYRWAGFWRRLTPRFLNLVTLPKWLSAKQDGAASRYHRKPAASDDQARFILKGLLRSCRRHLDALEPRESQGDSVWSGYADRCLYTKAQFARKEAFVAEALALAEPRQVLDVGANRGHFSFLAARRGSSVVAIDSDSVVAGSLWREASREQLDVLPMVVDLARPTPAMGWRNQECASFLDRARGGFDMVLMLAVVHHLLVTERIPLEDLLALAAELTRDYLVIELVAPEDPMFQRIVRGRNALYSDLTKDRFESAAAQRFELVKSLQIDGMHRCVYLFRLRRRKS